MYKKWRNWDIEKKTKKKLLTLRWQVERVIVKNEQANGEMSRRMVVLEARGKPWEAGRVVCNVTRPCRKGRRPFLRKTRWIPPQTPPSTLHEPTSDSHTCSHAAPSRCSFPFLFFLLIGLLYYIYTTNPSHRLCETLFRLTGRSCE